MQRKERIKKQKNILSQSRRRMQRNFLMENLGRGLIDNQMVGSPLRDFFLLRSNLDLYFSSPDKK